MMIDTMRITDQNRKFILSHIDAHPIHIIGLYVQILERHADLYAF